MKKKVIIILFILAMIWGGGYVASQFAFDENWNEFTVLLIRNGFSFLVMLFFTIKNKIKLTKSLLFHGSLCGVTYFGGYALQLIGQNNSSVSTCAFLSSIVIVMVPIMGIFLKRKPSKTAIIGCVIGLIGACILTYGPDFSINIASILILLADILYATHYIQVDIALNKSKLDIIAFLCVQYFFMTIGSGIGMTITKVANPETILFGTSKGLYGVLYYAVLSGVIGVFIQAWSQKYVETSKVSLILSLESLFAIIFGIILLNEIDKLNVQTIVGGVIMLIAVAITQYFEIRLENKNKRGKKYE